MKGTASARTNQSGASATVSADRPTEEGPHRALDEADHEVDEVEVVTPEDDLPVAHLEGAADPEVGLEPADLDDVGALGEHHAVGGGDVVDARLEPGAVAGQPPSCFSTARSPRAGGSGTFWYTIVGSRKVIAASMSSRSSAPRNPRTTSMSVSTAVSVMARRLVTPWTTHDGR